MDATKNKPDWLQMLESSLLVAICFASLLTWLALVTAWGDAVLGEGVFSALLAPLHGS